jgi:hypothetical protein
VFPARDGVKGFHDLTPRFGLAYDLFANRKTSLKVHAGRYLEAAAVLGIYSSQNTVLRVAGSTNRTWTDANRNFLPGDWRPNGRWEPDGRAKQLAARCADSRKALGVDRIRLFQPHALDPARCVYVGSGSQDPGFARRPGFQYRDAGDFFGCAAGAGPLTHTDTGGRV